jgi:hypothetical protein
MCLGVPEEVIISLTSYYSKLTLTTLRSRTRSHNLTRLLAKTRLVIKRTLFSVYHHLIPFFLLLDHLEVGFLRWSCISFYSLRMVDCRLRG